MMLRSLASAAFGGLLAVSLAAGSAAAAPTLDAIKQRGLLQCGVTSGVTGFSFPDDKGAWKGLDADYCRALAAAIFGDASKVKFVPLTSKDRFTALQSGDVDVLHRVTTWTMSRDTANGFNFAGINFFDGQGFLVAKKLGVKSATELGGASVCVQQGTTTELNVADYFRLQGQKYEPVAFATSNETIKAFDAGRCDVFSMDVSAIYSERLKLSRPDDYVVLPEIISKEPFAAVVRQGDDQWYDIVKWVHFALLNAEELGITQANVADKTQSPNPEIKRLLGQEGKFGEAIGLGNDWVVQIVKAVGNYGEIYERNVGKDSVLNIPRGVNALWNKGGLHYAPPVR